MAGRSWVGLGLAFCVGAAAAAAALALRPGSGTPASVAGAPAGLLSVPRIGIVSPMGMEQAPVLARMRVQRTVRRHGYTFYLGTLGGVPVVDVRSGEKEYAAEMATTIMDLSFPIRASLLSGTAGAQSPYVRIGDVVLGGYVLDKSVMHYHRRGFVSPYHGVEILTAGAARTGGDLVAKHGHPGPTPQDAKTYGYGPKAASARYAYVEALAGSAGLARAGLAAAAGLAAGGGSPSPRVVLGAIGSANQWTAPLAWQAAQHALYQTDAGENEGMGFAYANAELGVPSLVVRGISDSAWAHGYQGLLAARRAAAVAAYIVGHLPAAKRLDAPVRMSMLWARSNARVNGYLVAQRVYVGIGPVTQVRYAGAGGRTVTLKNPFRKEYASTP